MLSYTAQDYLYSKFFLDGISTANLYRASILNPRLKGRFILFQVIKACLRFPVTFREQVGRVLSVIRNKKSQPQDVH